MKNAWGEARRLGYLGGLDHYLLCFLLLWSGDRFCLMLPRFLKIKLPKLLIKVCRSSIVFNRIQIELEPVRRLKGVLKHICSRQPIVLLGLVLGQVLLLYAVIISIPYYFLLDHFLYKSVLILN